MTEQEAIKAIENDLKWHSKELKPKYKEALRLAIKALEKQVALKKFIETMKKPQYECFVTDRNGVIDILDAFLIDWE